METKSKEEILDLALGEDFKVNKEVVYTSAMHAMVAYAEEESISFAEWVVNNGYQFVKYGDGTEGWTNTNHFGTHKELYQLYKKETKQTKTS